MSYAISNAISIVKTDVPHETNKASIACDLTVIVALSMIGGLMLGNVMTFGLSMEAGKLGSRLAWGFVGTALLLTAIDGIAKFLIERPKEIRLSPVFKNEGISDQKRNEIQKIIRSTGQTNPSQEEIEKAKQESCHLILEGLYLGQQNALYDTLQECPFIRRSDRANPHEFQTVITAFHIPNHKDEIGKDLKEHGIGWYDVGRMVQDQPDFWMDLVCNCTFPTAPLTAREEEVDQERAVKDLRRAKEELVPHNPMRWFEPLFQEFAQAMIHGKKVLVHCGAGVSRSTTLIAAYLIKEFDVTADEAINFLKSKRACVESEFMEPLRDYEQALKEARARG